MTKTLPDDIKMTGNDYDKEGDIICISYKYSGDKMDYYDMQIPADRCDHSANIGVSVPV